MIVGCTLLCALPLPALTLLMVIPVVSGALVTEPETPMKKPVAPDADRTLGDRNPVTVCGCPGSFNEFAWLCAKLRSRQVMAF
jgi:hypothetical protein